MKSKLSRRIIALVLCMVLLLGSGGISILIDVFHADEVSSEAETGTDTTMVSGQVSGETTSDTPTIIEEPSSEKDSSETEPGTDDSSPEKVPAVVQEELELKQELRDEDGAVLVTVTANIPAESFAGVEASAVSMEVTDVDEKEKEELQLLMEQGQTAEQKLGDYFLYHVSFKVNGEEVKPEKEIKLTFEKPGFEIEDGKKATFFYYSKDADDSKLVEIIPKEDEVPEKDSETEIWKITMEGTQSAIYGCYLSEDKIKEADTEAAKTEEPKTEASNTEDTKTENTKTENTKTEDTKTDDSKAETLQEESEENSGVSTQSEEPVNEAASENSSAYTITWVNSSKGTASFKLKLVDEQGNELENVPDINVDGLPHNKTEITIADAAKALNISNIGGYTLAANSSGKVAYTNEEGTAEEVFNSLAIWKGDSVADFHGQTWPGTDTTIRCKGGKSGQKVITSEDTVYFVYCRPLSEVATVDSQTAGLSVEMFNYSAPAAIGAGAYTENGTKGNIRFGILGNKIADGEEFPTIVKGSNANAKTIEEWFTGGTEVNHLFLKDVYDSEGYYYYSSLDNYAYLGTGSDFTVYDQIGTPGNTNIYYFQRGNFMPYNKIAAGAYSSNKNLYDENGTLLGDDHPRNNEVLYKTVGTNDYYFGMYMHANFAQLKNGQFNGSDMIYEFAGDDDLWVYIDGVLVLDIGGIHDTHSGNINFATGVVTTYDSVRGAAATATTKTIRQLFEEAGISTADFKGDTFDDFTNHKIQMFYMERGAEASTLKMKVNLPVVPEGSVQVQKSLSNTDKEKYANVQFGFQMYLEDLDSDGTGLGTYSVYKPDNAVLRDGTKVEFESDGTFYLKPTQIATFPDLAVTRKYYVKEVNVKTNEYDQVEINGTVISSDDGKEIFDVKSTEDSVANRGFLNFTNNCSAANRRELKLVKQMAEGQTSEDEFTFLVKLESTGGEMVPYKGKYFLRNVADDDTVDSISLTTNDGMIKIKAGQMAIIDEILSGTRFSVEELLEDVDYTEPELQIKDCSDSSVKDGVAAGEIQLGKDGIVTVTNRKLQVSVDIRKYGSSYTEEELEGAHFSLYSGSLATDETSENTGSLKNAILWNAAPYEGYSDITLSDVRELNLTAGYYKLTETRSPTGYALLKTPILFRVSGGQVSLVNEYGEMIDREMDMWKLETDQEGGILSIKNEKLNELPETGGIGTFWYTIGGILFMIAAASILYKQQIRQRKGE